MSVKRVQKLLFSDYCDFEDMVLIESPFAQTTREGKGLRQVQIGLTPSRLVLAADVLPPADESRVDFFPGVDPEIETFELVAIYPVDCLNLSVFRRRKRQTLKAHFCNDRVCYFELGGFENRTMFWNLWCEKVKFLSPESGSSQSETSVVTSSTNSTLYLVQSREIVKPNGLKQVWCKFGKDTVADVPPKWTDRRLHIGKSLDEFNHYKPIMNKPSIAQFIKPKQISTYFAQQNQLNPSSEVSDVHVGDSQHVNRFGLGIKENCTSALFLSVEDFLRPRKLLSQSSAQSSAMLQDFHPSADPSESLAEACVRHWELNAATTRRHRHKRRYGIAPQPLFLYGLGPWNINPGAKYSIQVKRAVSVVSIRRQPIEPELRLPVTKRQLVATISCDTLYQSKAKSGQVSCGPVIFFWTPDYWYRPRTAKDAYQELQNHLNKLKEYQQKIKKRRRIFRRRAVPQKYSTTDSESDSEETRQSRYRRKKRNPTTLNMLGDMALCCLMSPDRGKSSSSKTSIQYLKRLLKVNVLLTAWDFKSAVLAQQLTMIDRDLFLKITGLEMGVLVSQQSSKNAPNVAAMVAFAHRISCLVASDVLRNDCERMRARLIARFISVAEKCHRLSNFHSCRTVLFGLQSPAVYRLKKTWSHVRKKHASKYQVFESLCRLYRDPRLLCYQRTFLLSCKTTPYMPFVGDVIAKLLDRIPEYKIKKSRGINCPSYKDSLFAKFLSSIRLINFGSVEEKKGLCHYYKPLDCYEDNRAKCVLEATEFLQQCQLSALHYNFPRNDLAADYLLKARYKEERENFYYSVRLETVDAE